MDILTVVLVIVLLVVLVGGVGYPRPADGPAVVNTILYLLAVIVLIVLVLKLLGLAL